MEIFQAETGNLLTICICILLALAGFNLGISGKVVESLKSAGLRVILFPFAAVGGSLLGGLVYGLLSPLSIREAVAISAGFGWYTLAPTIITEAGFAVAGAISFMPVSYTHLDVYKRQVLLLQFVPFHLQEPDYR